MLRVVSLLLSGALTLVGLGTLVMTPISAAADVPPAPVAAFTAPACPGSTDTTPDLSVTGADLAAYNAGEVVAIYDYSGMPPETLADPADELSFPPLCGVRYLDEANGGPLGGGPVSAWMFCSNVTRHACNDGRPLQPEPDQNAAMSDFERRVFAYIVQHGHSYLPDAGFPMPGAAPLAVATSTSDDRARLQYLLWCVHESGVSARYTQFCQLNGLDPASIAVDYAFLAVSTTPVLAFSAATYPTAPTGDTVTLTLRTTIVEAPLTISHSAGTLTLCPGEADATLAASTLTAMQPGTPGSIVDIDLCITSAAPASATIEVSGMPTTEDTLNWYHNGDPDCQIYATFVRIDAATLHASTSTAFAAPLGAFSVTKTVTAAPGIVVSGSTTFPVTYDCGGGIAGTLLLVPGVAGSVTGIPIGSVCALSETLPADPQHGRWGAPTWDPGGVTGTTYSVTITAGSATTPISVALTNTAESTAVAMRISKQVSGAVSAYTGGSFRFRYSCTAPDGHITRGAVLIGGGGNALISPLEPASTCVLEEMRSAAPSGHRWAVPTVSVTGTTAVTISGRDVTLVLPPTGSATTRVAFDNRLESASGLALTGGGVDGLLATGTLITLAGVIAVVRSAAARRSP